MGHAARPITQLRDPSSFGPPPKRDPSQPYVPGSVQRTGAHGYEEPEEEHKPPVPYRVDTTGLSTTHLPAPPLRRDAAAAVSDRPPPPSLPPRLPPRGGSTSPTSPSRSPTTGSHASLLPQGSVGRLGAAGISVPGFGIGKSNPAASGTVLPPPSGSSPTKSAQLGEVQSRFSKLGMSSSSTSSTAPTEGTTMVQKQAAFKTASAFHKDPSSVSMSDARSAASTMNNFRQRHGDQVAAGAKTAGDLNQKYGIQDRVGGLAAQVGGGKTAQPGQAAGILPPPGPGLLGKKKPPPPPPKKKPGLSASGQGSPEVGDEPPPLPLSTRPTF